LQGVAGEFFISGKVAVNEVAEKGVEVLFFGAPGGLIKGLNEGASGRVPGIEDRFEDMLPVQVGLMGSH
jgi:hypothetical protein